eukprot:jgi/Bigna1/134820/aug1.26_g9528
MLKLVQTCASALDHNVVDKKDGSFEVKEFNDSQLASLLEVLTEIAKVMTAEGDIQVKKKSGRVGSKGGGESTDDSEGPVVAATHDQLDLSGTYISLDRTKYAIDGEGVTGGWGKKEKKKKKKKKKKRKKNPSLRFCREGKKGMCDMALAQSRPFAQLKVLPPVKEDTVALVKMTYLDDDHDPFTGDIEDSSLLIKWEDGDEWIRWRRGSGGARNKKQRADLSWMLKHMAKFREILERFAVDGFVPEMRDSITTFWNASTKLQSYYPAKFKEIAASMKNQYLAPPSQKNKAVQLEPPLILDLGAPGVDGGPLKSGWVLREEEGSGIQGALEGANDDDDHDDDDDDADVDDAEGGGGGDRREGVVDGLCEEHPGHYAVSPPESIKGGIRGKEEKRGFGQFIGKATAVVGNVGAKLFGEKGPRGWIKTDIKRSVGWHTFTTHKEGHLRN